MSQAKLTLHIDRHLIARAKKVAQECGKSLSQMVTDYFLLLESESKKTEPQKISPMVRSLKGILRGKKITKRDYLKYLEEKYNPLA